jgi:hypothetical protein
LPVTSEPTPGARWLQTRPADLVAETLSDETLVIDTATGVFFSLRGVSSGLWAMLEQTAGDEELRRAVRDHFPDARDTDADVDAYLAALEADGLVIETDTPRAGESATTGPWPDGYDPPLVKKYDDMADLLLVDPIHDVATESGWPDRQPDSP